MLIFILFFVKGLNYPFLIPNEYEKGQKVEIFVKNLFSSGTQLPFEYYHLNFCKPRGYIQGHAEDIGKILSGNSLEVSPYQIQVDQPSDCILLCTRKNSKEQIESFKWMIENDYYVSLVLDNLPSALRITYENNEMSQSEKFKFSIYQDGFRVGYKHLKKFYIYNHLNLIVKVYCNKGNFRIVGFLVEPLSLENKEGLRCESQEFIAKSRQSLERQENVIPPDESEHLKENNNKFWPFESQELSKEISFTYSVFFERSTIKWASRWDMYLYGAGKKSDVHWLSIINSFSLVLFLSGIIAQILCRTIRKNLEIFNETDMLEARETGWKQIRGEIFRKPEKTSLFCAIIGTGVQIVLVLLFSLSFACMGFLIPEYREFFMIGTFCLYLLLGFAAGFTSARLYQMFELTSWAKNLVLCASLFPGTSFLIFSVINLCALYEGSSGAIPFKDLMIVSFLFWSLLLCLVFLGGKAGRSQKIIENPCKVNQIPRKSFQVAPWKVHFVFFLAGSLPFGCMFIELNYVMKSMWHHSLFYYLFGFLYLCFFVLIVTSAEVSILMSYLLICMQDHRWWWISFEVAGASGVYFFIYSFVYYYAELNFSRASSFVFYFGYMFLASATYTLITGTIGFLATFAFMRTIYSMIKSD
jgi:transmembrane 9 superfamily protein 2/4